MGSVPSAIPSAVTPSTGDTVRILTEPQLGPYQPMTGNSFVPAVPNNANPDDVSAQPHYGTVLGEGGQYNAGSAGAPTVPGMGGVIFRSPEIDGHYQSEDGGAPYPVKVNNPPTRGMFTWVKGFINGIATSQDTDTTGMKQRHPQQRTSYMRITPPPNGAGTPEGLGYRGGEQFTPRQMPQQPNTYGFPPSTGTTEPGIRVLNSSAFGAGQTAGGVGGSNYTPTPGPPPTTSTASADIANGRGMPTWG